jgi:hypothetical protein
LRDHHYLHQIYILNMYAKFEKCAVYISFTLGDIEKVCYGPRLIDRDRDTGSSDHGLLAHFKTTYTNTLSILSNLLNCAQLINYQIQEPSVRGWLML